MQCASAQYQHVPDSVIVGELFPGVEYDAESVRQPSEQQQCKAEAGDMDEDFPDRNNAQPAHAKIEGNGNLLEPRDTDTFQNDSADCTCPDDAENAPAPDAPESYNREGSIRACDQKIDCRVIDDLEKPLGGALAQSVVKRRRGIEKNKCGAKNQETHNMPGRSAIDGTDNQNNQADDAKRRPKAVRKTVGYLFTKRVSPHSMSPCVRYIHSLWRNCHTKDSKQQAQI